MSEERDCEGPEQVKTCSTCGGTWPASRPRCVACGANLAEVPVQAPESADGATFDWSWLDAMAGESGERSSAPSSGAEPAERPGCLARIFPGLE